mmetsp:Transcript_47350/g.34646  ORF Transcript_47350/g.34646 Transcript_47350/m.34646 type:complete len:134 (+) Transcript_47350:425-826(+)|eukprot:CAMPEP_0202980516 /NCGR_PEP_ID=MMETSP1396-20130829/86434_1 /ASSEMBLY_ACC=CAM_ASM_000872 /TAXON_ID= /ORGANISM="Pseudokeronopsis sp., Strain Brazil" /LENGTH=133 /DNA_ID=CAMNT_0049720553 /DNA_START=409 /DNA_END=810 /DNA_ORIENTATION=-
MSDLLGVSGSFPYEAFESFCRSTPGLYCDKCREVKPVRTHHCSVCGKCALGMDHHCMWTNNCIGLHNQKYLVQVKLYGILGCFATALTLWVCESHELYDEWNIANLFTFQKYFDIVVGKLLLLLLGWDLYLVL